MPFCGTCGLSMSETAGFCPTCGTRAAGGTSASAVGAPVVDRIGIEMLKRRLRTERDEQVAGVLGRCSIRLDQQPSSLGTRP